MEKIGALKPDYASMPWSMGDSLPFEGKGGKEWVRCICVVVVIVVAFLSVVVCVVILFLVGFVCGD